MLIDEVQVRSGMLIMPNPNVPNDVWEIAETEEMKEVVGLYGKTYHFWQVDRGDTLPLGKPELMISFTKDEQVSDLQIISYLRYEGCTVEILTRSRCPGRRSRIEMRGSAWSRAERRRRGRKSRA